MSSPNSNSAVPRLVTLKDARQFLPLSIRTLYKLAKSGELATVRVGRRVLVSVEGLSAFVAKCSTKGNASVGAER